MEGLREQLLEILATTLTILVGIVVNRVMAYLKQKGILAKIEAKREVAGIVVNAVEQLYHAEKGAEKLETAKEKVINILLENGINVSQDELNMLIESAVKGMNEGVEKERLATLESTVPMLSGQLNSDKEVLEDAANKPKNKPL